MSTYRLRVRKTALHNASNDIGILLTSYLTGGTTNEPIYDSSGRVDLFLVQTAKSLLPGSGYLAYLQTLATNAIATKYNQTVSGVGTGSSNIITGIADTTGIIPGMSITGPGVAASSTVAAVLSSTSIQVSSTLNRTYTAVTTAPTIVRNGTVGGTIVRNGTTTTSSASITGLSQTSDLSVGMQVVGSNIPAGATITFINSSSAITISQAATSSTTLSLTFITGTLITGLSQTSDLSVGMSVSGTGVPTGSVITVINSSSSVTISFNVTTSGTVSLTFSINPASSTVTSVVTAELTSSYVGMGVTGVNITTDTVVRNVLSASSFVMTNNATASGATSVTFTGPANFALSTSNWTFDFTDLQKVVNEINFALL